MPLPNPLPTLLHLNPWLELLKGIPCFCLPLRLTALARITAATCTASSIASLLDVIPGDQSEHFRVLFGGEEQLPSSDIFAVFWHERKGVACLLESFDNISEHCHQNRLQPSYRCACLWARLVIHASSPFVQGIDFPAPTAQYAMAASPVALLVGNGGFQALFEGKCVPSIYYWEGWWQRVGLASIQADLERCLHSCVEFCAVPSLSPDGRCRSTALVQNKLFWETLATRPSLCHSIRNSLCKCQPC